jgi:hypothetical protein
MTLWLLALHRSPLRRLDAGTDTGMKAAYLDNGARGNNMTIIANGDQIIRTKTDGTLISSWFQPLVLATGSSEHDICHQIMVLAIGRQCLLF